MRGTAFFQVEKARIEIVPMIDIMMFLLIFFIMITLKMIAGSGIKLELPTSSTAEELEKIKITIGVAKDGYMVVDGTPMEEAALRERLRAAKDMKADIDIVLAGDKQLPLQGVIKVMDIVRSEGIKAIGLVARAE
jgi:biopolymer transport protein ExbD